MALDVENQKSMDWLKWIIVTALIITGLTANYYYIQQPWPLRLLGWLVLFGLVVPVAFQTTQGKQLMAFARDSRAELRKVVWPTRQETIQTTLVIAAMVIVLAFVLWGVDGFLVWLIGWLTGQRGH